MTDRADDGAWLLAGVLARAEVAAALGVAGRPARVPGRLAGGARAGIVAGGWPRLLPGPGEVAVLRVDDPGGNLARYAAVFGMEPVETAAGRLLGVVAGQGGTEPRPGGEDGGSARPPVAAFDAMPPLTSEEKALAPQPAAAPVASRPFAKGAMPSQPPASGAVPLQPAVAVVASRPLNDRDVAPQPLASGAVPPQSAAAVASRPLAKGAMPSQPPASEAMPPQPAAADAVASRPLTDRAVAPQPLASGAVQPPAAEAPPQPRAGDAVTPQPATDHGPGHEPDPALVAAIARAILDTPDQPAATLARRLPQIAVAAASTLRAEAMRRPRACLPGTGHDAVEILARRQHHAGYFATETVTLSHARHDGGMTPPVTREVFTAGDAVLVLPWDRARDRVLVIDQFRAAMAVRGEPLPWMVEAIAGRIDPGETPAAAAIREAVEEARLAIDPAAMVPGPHHYPSPGVLNEYLYAYVALTDLPDGIAGLAGLEDETEDIRAHLMPRAELAAMARRGEVPNGPLALLVLWLEAEAPRLLGRADGLPGAARTDAGRGPG